MESYSTNDTNQTFVFYGHSFKIYNSVERPIYILLDVYSRLIKPTNKVSSICFYNQNKTNTNYFFVTQNNSQNEEIQEFVVRGKIVFITKEGVEKLAKNNKNKIKEFTQPTDIQVNQVQDTHENEEEAILNCCVCSCEFASDQLFSIENFKNNYYKFINELTDYQKLNVAIQCSQCKTELVCLLCVIKQYFITNQSACPICKTLRSLSIGDQTSDIRLVFQEQRMFKTLKLIVSCRFPQYIYVIQIDRHMKCHLEIHNTASSNQSVKLYDYQTKSISDSPFILQCMVTAFPQDPSPILGIYHRKENIGFADNNNDYQFLNSNAIRWFSQKRGHIKTYKGNELTNFIDLSYDRTQVVLDLDLPTSAELDQLLETEAQAVLAPKSFSMYSMKNRIYISKESYKSAEVISNHRLIVFVQSFSCYCGEGLPANIFRIYNKEQKQFTLKDIMYNLKKQGFEGVCNHSFYEGFSKINDFTFEMNFGS